MPIRINLLAEAQAAEELRRRDPVKRAIWVGALVLAVVLAWGSSLQYRIMSDRLKLNNFQATLTSQTNEYHQILLDQKQLARVNQNLGALKQLATNRFLWGTVLDALQRTTVADVRLLRLKADQLHLLTEKTNAKTNELGKVTPGTPALTTERVVLTLAGVSQSDEGIQRYVDTLNAYPYFQAQLADATNKFTLKSRQAIRDPTSGRESREFTLEYRFPEKVRR